MPVQLLLLLGHIPTMLSEMSCAPWYTAWKILNQKPTWSLVFKNPEAELYLLNSYVEPPLSNMAVPETRLLGSDNEKRTKWWEPPPIRCMASASLSMWTRNEKTRKTYRRRATVWKSGDKSPVRNNSANTAISGSKPLALTEINLLRELPTLRSSVKQAWTNTGSRVVASSPEHEKDHHSAESTPIIAVSQHPSWRQQNGHFWHEFPHIFQTTSRTPCPDLQLLHFSQLLNYLIIELGKPKLKLHR